MLMEENLKRGGISVWQLQKVPSIQIANNAEILTLAMLDSFCQFDTHVGRRHLNGENACL